jgi:hypothetical protein
MFSSSRYEVCWLAMVLTGYFFLAGWTAFSNSPTYDEPLHVTSGVSYWQHRDFRLQPENGVLSQRWIGLGPRVLTDADVKTDSPAWQRAAQWIVAREFMAQHGLTVLRIGRWMTVLAGAGLLLMLYQWSRRLWGRGGALVTVVLAAFSPTLLAHTTLATSDVMLAFTFFWASRALLILQRSPSIRTVLIAGAACGAAALSKYSSIVLAPYAVGLLILHGVFCRPPRLWRSLTHRVGALLLAALLAYGVIWAGYGFRYAAFHPEQASGAFLQPWDRVQSGSAADGIIAFLREGRLLPEAYLYGAAQTYTYSQERAAFFMGEVRGGGWVRYFPTAFLAKSSPWLILGSLALGILTLKGRIRERIVQHSPADRNDLRLEVCAASLAGGLFFLFCMTSNLNIGHRHMLPVYPFLFLILGGLWPGLATKPAGRAVLTGGLALHVLLAVMTAPSYLSFINIFFGGPEAGHRLFADSSYDWGQDMGVLAEWLETQEDLSGRPQLALFSPLNPEALGIEGDVMYQYGGDFQRGYSLPPFRPGRIAVSATILSGTYFNIPSKGWTAELEDRYWASRHLVARVLEEAGTDPERWLHVFAEQPDIPWSNVVQLYSRLRVKRYLHLLETRPVEARPADTVFIWQVDTEFLEEFRLLEEPVLPDDFNLHSVLRRWEAGTRGGEVTVPGEH